MAFGLGRAGGATVRLAVDDTAFNRDLARDAANFRRTTTGMQGDLGKLSRGALAGSGVFHGFARSIAFASGAFLGGAGLTAVIKQSISAASDLNEQINKTRVVFGEGGQAVIAFSKTTTNSFGIAQNAALAYAGTFGNMLVPMGFARREAAAMSVQMVKLAADMASFNNASPQDVLEALRSGLAGETEPLRRFGVFLSEARIQQELMNAGIKVTPGHVSAAQKAWATYRIILKDTKDAQGDFARTSGSLANQQRTLQARIQQTEISIGKALMPTVLGITKSMNQWLASDENQARVQEIVTGAVKRGLGIFQALRDVVKALAPIMDGLASALGGVRNEFQLIFALAVATKLRGIALGLGLQGGGVAGGAAAARTEVGLLAGALRGLLGIGVITVAIELLIHRKWVGDKIGDIIDKALGVPSTPGAAPDVPATSGVVGDAIRDMARRGLNARQIQQRLRSQYGITVTLAQVNAVLGTGGTTRITTAQPGAIVQGGGQLIGRPGQGTHSRTERGYVWQDDDAVDIEVKPGANIYAVDAGTIGDNLRYGGDSGRFSGWGFTLSTIHGAQYFYKHLKHVVIKKGQRVKKGQLLGYGTTTGHLHLARRGATNVQQVLHPEIPTGGTSGADLPSTISAPAGTGAGSLAAAKDVGVTLELGAGTTYKGETLDDEQRENAQLIYDIATQRGLSPRQALELVAVAYAESGLRTNAINKKSGAFGLFQLLSPGYVKKYNQLRRQGYSPAVANLLAILPNYQAFFKAHPNARPGQAGATVEASGAGAGFYAKGIGTTFQLGRGRAGGGTDFPDPVSTKLENQLLQAEVAGNLEQQLKILDKIIGLLNRAIAKSKSAAQKNKLLKELQGYLGQRKDVRAQIAEGFKTSLETAMSSIGKDITGAENVGQVEDILDAATGKVVGKQFAEQTTVRWDPKTHTWITVKIRPTLDAAKKELDYIMNVVVPGIQKRIDSLNGKIKAYAKHPKRNARLIADARARRNALIKERDDIIAMAQDLAAWIAEMEAALKVPPDQETGGGGEGSHEKNAETPFDYTSIPTALRLQGALAGETPGFADDISYLRSVEDLYTARLGQRGLSPDDRIALLQARQGIREQLASAVTAVDLNLALGAAQARRTPGTADDRAITQQIYDIALARLREARTIQEQIALTNQLADLEEQLKNTRAQENQELIQYLTSRRELVRQYAGNLYSPTGMLGGGGITLNNYFGASPADPHLFSSQVAFDLGALVG